MVYEFTLHSLMSMHKLKIIAYFIPLKKNIIVYDISFLNQKVHMIISMSKKVNTYERPFKKELSWAQ